MVCVGISLVVHGGNCVAVRTRNVADPVMMMRVTEFANEYVFADVTKAHFAASTTLPPVAAISLLREFLGNPYDLPQTPISHTLSYNTIYSTDPTVWSSVRCRCRSTEHAEIKWPGCWPDSPSSVPFSSVVFLFNLKCSRGTFARSTYLSLSRNRDRDNGGEFRESPGTAPSVGRSGSWKR